MLKSMGRSSGFFFFSPSNLCTNLFLRLTYIGFPTTFSQMCAVKAFIALKELHKVFSFLIYLF